MILICTYRNPILLSYAPTDIFTLATIYEASNDGFCESKNKRNEERGFISPKIDFRN